MSARVEVYAGQRGGWYVRVVVGDVVLALDPLAQFAAREGAEMVARQLRLALGEVACRCGELATSRFCPVCAMKATDAAMRAAARSGG